MELSAETELLILKKHRVLSIALNLDKLTNYESWKSFSQYYDGNLFEGDVLHWIGTAVYVICRSSVVPTSKSNVVIQGNPIHLCQLLKLININTAEFFEKAKRWAQFTQSSQSVIEKICYTERSFQVSAAIFKKFCPIFKDMFLPETADGSKGNKYKKFRTPVTSDQVFEFTWTLFITVKSAYENICDDLVSSYHLLLACCDFIFANVILLGRKDFVNPEFPEAVMPQKTASASLSLPCIIDALCQRHDGISVDAKAMREYYFRKEVKKLFTNKILKGNSELLSEVLDGQVNFEVNLKSLNKAYDEYALSTGDFDERVLLGSSVNNSIVNGSIKTEEALAEIAAQIEQKRKISNHGLRTPLSGKMCAELREPVSEGGTSSRTKAALQYLIKDLKPAPSAQLQYYISQCKKPIKLEEIIDQLSETLEEKLLEKTDKVSFSQEMAKFRVDATRKLYYRLVDLILARELSNPNFHATAILSLNLFHSTLFACAAEIVMFAFYNAHPFPFVLDALKVEPYDFYRIIEVVVRADDFLNRDIVKHLNEVEECVLEALAWRAGSPLWRALCDTGLPIPLSEEVVLHGLLSRAASGHSENRLDLDQLAGRTAAVTSPGAPITDSFMSPLKKAGLKWHSSDPEPGSVLPPKVAALAPSVEEPTTPAPATPKAKRTGSVALFFRKFYYLASVRLRNLCDQLKVSDTDLRQKIWTCFEQSLVKNIGLLHDRHLDQLIMCSIYVICKKIGPECKFTDLMAFYRNQPQARSHVYRNVLMGPVRTLQDITDSKSDTPPGTRGDIILFYNNIFVFQVEEIVDALTHANVDPTNRLELSPLPVNKTLHRSPWRRVSEKHALFLKQFEKGPLPPSSPQLSYFFNQSPSKDLHAINKMVSQQRSRVNKQLLQDDDSENQPKAELSSTLQDYLVGTLQDRNMLQDKLKTP